MVAAPGEKWETKSESSFLLLISSRREVTCIWNITILISSRREVTCI